MKIKFNYCYKFYSSKSGDTCLHPNLCSGWPDGPVLWSKEEHDAGCSHLNSGFYMSSFGTRKRSPISGKISGRCWRWSGFGASLCKMIFYCTFPFELLLFFLKVGSPSGLPLFEHLSSIFRVIHYIIHNSYIL